MRGQGSKAGKPEGIGRPRSGRRRDRPPRRLCSREPRPRQSRFGSPRPRSGASGAASALTSAKRGAPSRDHAEGDAGGEIPRQRTRMRHAAVPSDVQAHERTAPARPNPRSTWGGRNRRSRCAKRKMCRGGSLCFGSSRPSRGPFPAPRARLTHVSHGVPWRDHAEAEKAVPRVPAAGGCRRRERVDVGGARRGGARSRVGSPAASPFLRLTSLRRARGPVARSAAGRCPKHDRRARSAVGGRGRQTGF